MWETMARYVHPWSLFISQGLIHNKVYYAKELLGKKYIDHDWFKNTGMQYRIYNANNTLLIELMFNNNIPRLFKAETIVAKILMFCKASIENFVGDEGYLAVFNVIHFFF